MRTILLTLVGMLFITCTTRNQLGENAPLYDKVMAVHDEIMPRMGEIEKAARLNKKTLEEKLFTSSADSLMLVNLTNSLEKADKAMWDWMHNFEKSKAVGESGKDYLKDQQIQINNVKKLMTNSINNSNKFHAERK